MCRKKIILILVWFALSSFGGYYLGELVNSLFLNPPAAARVFVFACCIFIIALFLLPFLDWLTE